MTDESLLHSPLQSVHEALGATFTTFAGWRMPARYTSDLAEHRAVRTGAGIFDLSHMGEIRIRGAEAGEALDHALAGKLSGLVAGRAKYSLLLDQEGGILDDLVVYRLPDGDYLAVVNAANAQRDLAALIERSQGFDSEVVDETAGTALIAVQGPDSATIVAEALASSNMNPGEVSSLGYYRCRAGTFEGDPLLIARTGYTGEDGFELYVRSTVAQKLWQTLSTGAGVVPLPCGLACRDTLRLEAGMPLYGHELTTATRPAQAGLGRVVSFGKPGDFVGRAALEGRAASSIDHSDPVLVGLAGQGRRAARAGYAVLDAAGDAVGRVTSGALSPTLGHPVAMAYLEPGSSEPGTRLAVDVRGARLPFTVVPLPFYTRS